MKGIQHFKSFAYSSRPSFETHSRLITLLRLWKCSSRCVIPLGFRVIQLGYVCSTDACGNKHTLKWKIKYLLLSVNCTTCSHASLCCPILPMVDHYWNLAGKSCSRDKSKKWWKLEVRCSKGCDWHSLKIAACIPLLLEPWQCDLFIRQIPQVARVLILNPCWQRAWHTWVWKII